MTVEDIADQISARFCVRDPWFMALLMISRDEYKFDVEGIMRQTIERLVREVTRRRYRRQNGLLTAEECEDLAAMEERLERRCDRCGAGRFRLPEKHFWPVPESEDESWKQLQWEKLMLGVASSDD